MSEEDSQNFSNLEFREQLYVFYLEIKGELTKKNIEIEKEQLQEIANSTKPSIILNYIRELFYILINQKFLNDKETDYLNNKNSNINKDIKLAELYQLENHIKKLECDIRYFMQKEFQNKIKRDTLEMKLNAYMEMENEFEELKEKVKYEGGKFLNNERKDNEIIILRQENSLLKKDIEKYKENNDIYESKIKLEQETITELKKQISSLNKKVTKIEKENIKQPNNNNNSSINININNNGNSSSKWIIKQENQEISNMINNKNSINNNSINQNSNSGSNFSLKKRKINNFTKNYRKDNSKIGNNTSSNYNLQIRSKLNNYEKRGYSGFHTKNHNSHNRINNNIENNAFTSTYNKIFNSLYTKNKTPNKRDTNKKKRLSNTICVDDYERTIINNINKNRKFKFNCKNNSYNKILGIIQNTRFPLSSKHQANKNYNSTVKKKNLKREKSAVNHSSIAINNKK